MHFYSFLCIPKFRKHFVEPREISSGKYTVIGCQYQKGFPCSQTQQPPHPHCAQQRDPPMYKQECHVSVLVKKGEARVGGVPPHPLCHPQKTQSFLLSQRMTSVRVAQDLPPRPPTDDRSPTPDEGAGYHSLHQCPPSSYRNQPWQRTTQMKGWERTGRGQHRSSVVLGEDRCRSV